jgi:hypothetical protein
MLMPVLPRSVMAGMMKMMHAVMKTRKTQRGLTNLISALPTNLPAVNVPCAPARNRAAVSLGVGPLAVRRVSTT